jgi:2-keto-4-pentenoate hydratase/2-oxohepta-3-ene-1,7-dioic acid hydratase in catechol pathway
VKLVSFEVSTPLGPASRVGAVTDGRILDLTSAHTARLVGEGLPLSTARRMAEAVVPPVMRAFVEGGHVTLDAARDAERWARDLNATGPHGLRLWWEPGEVRMLPVITDPPMLRDFMAFEQHLQNIYPRLGREIPPEWYELPVYYKGNTASLGADGDDIPIPAYADELDFEFEFAAVIGKPGVDIDPGDAAEHIYGFTIYNDFSARVMQRREMAVGLGPAKGKDFVKAHVLGPWLVTRDEIADVYDLAMRAEVNGELWSESSTSTMHWKFEDMIAHASRDEPLSPGEVFGSGTVGDGAGAERGVSLHAGDEVALTVKGLGTLRNRVAP